jgi:hypothetical protein
VAGGADEAFRSVSEVFHNGTVRNTTVSVLHRNMSKHFGRHPRPAVAGQARICGFGSGYMPSLLVLLLLGVVSAQKGGGTGTGGQATTGGSAGGTGTGGQATTGGSAGGTATGGQATTGGSAGGSSSSGGGQQLSCPTGSDYVGSANLVGTAAALLGSVACVDVAAVAYRGTLASSVAGSDTSTVNLYGPFENGFSASVPGMSCLGTNTLDGGIDTYTAELMVRHLCSDDTMALLDTCGDHAQPRHFHEMLQNCLTYNANGSGHSTRLGTAGDDRGIYGRYESQGVEPLLDVCGAHVGFTPDSPTVAVVHCHQQGSDQVARVAQLPHAPSHA